MSFLFLIPLLAGAVLLGPRLFKRWWMNRPEIVQQHFSEILRWRREVLARTPDWRDPRPLHLFGGDSQIEGGDWYSLFRGARAVRNIGLSRARISDVEQLISSYRGKPPHRVILMCGINNLHPGASIAKCREDYKRLLTAAGELRPGEIVVLSVMPVHAANPEKNHLVAELNKELRQLCSETGARFLNINPAVEIASEYPPSLNPALTNDGLHLNPSGYVRLAHLIEQEL